MLSKKLSESQKGQSLMELVVVIAVMTIVIGALTFATIASLRNAQFSKNQTQATQLAEEGIELVRAGRDRNQCIDFPGTNINSWNGGNTRCNQYGSSSFWDYKLKDTCPNLPNSSACYFKEDDSSDTLRSKNTAPVPTPGNPLPAAHLDSSFPPFSRAIVLSDSSDNCTTSSGTLPCYSVEKKVMVIVSWRDFAGYHESKLTTVLRKL